MLQVKICGITTVEDAQACVAAGADAIGLNFFAQSPRFVSPAAAAEIARAIPAGVAKVGVFVNADARKIHQIWREVGFDLVQLHGDEPSYLVAELAAGGLPPVVRAFRLDSRGLGPILEYLQACRRLGCQLVATLLDAAVAGSYGGTGATSDWAIAASYPSNEGYPPLVLAGGLTPENVGEAIRRVLPQAVDTASGVESSPGRKDPAKLRAFVEAARAALAGTSRLTTEARRRGER